jgi:hypothetical protein
VFRRFIAVFARPEHPLALFLDDLQWLDAVSMCQSATISACWTATIAFFGPPRALRR